MTSFTANHTVNRRSRLERPASGRPADRAGSRRPAPRHIHEVLADLAQTRRNLEDLRRDSASFEERARLVSALHELRAEASVSRQVTGEM